MCLLSNFYCRKANSGSYTRRINLAVLLLWNFFIRIFLHLKNCCMSTFPSAEKAQERLKNVSRTFWEFSGDWALMYWWRRRLKTSGTNYTISFSNTILLLLLLCRDVFLHWTSVSGTDNFPDTDLQCRETPPATVREKEWPSFPVLENVVWKPRSRRGRNGIPKQRRCTLDSSYVSFVSH